MNDDVTAIDGWCDINCGRANIVRVPRGKFCFRRADRSVSALDNACVDKVVRAFCLCGCLKKCRRSDDDAVSNSQGD